MTAVALDRSQVLAHRVPAHGLDRRATAPTELALLDLGVQNTPPGAPAVALSARLADVGDALRPLSRAERAGLDAEAQRLGVVRGTPDVAVEVSPI